MGPSVLLLPIAAILLMTFGHPTVTPSAEEEEEENETDTPEDIDPRDPVNYDKYADTNETSGELEYEGDYTSNSNSSEESSEKRGYYADYEYFPGAFDPGQPSDPTFFKLPIYSLDIPFQGDAAATETEVETISPIMKDGKKANDMRVVFVQRRPYRGNGLRNQRRRRPPQQGIRNNATVLTGQNIPPLRVRQGIQRFQVRLNGRQRTKVQFRMQRGQVQVGRRRFVNRRKQQGAARALPDGDVLPTIKPLSQPPLPVQAADPNFLDSGLPV